MNKPDFSKYPQLENFLNKKDYFILDENKNAVPATCIEWGEFIENATITHTKHVADEIVNNKRVSTVFLGIDHNFLDFENKNPHIFETIVFSEDSMMDEYCDRYSTWQQAEEGHKKAVEWVKNGCKKEDENYCFE